MTKKNKKYRKQKEIQSFPWLFLAAGGALLLFATIFFANRASDSGGTPSILVDKQKIDFGIQKFGTNLTFTVKVTNTGNGTLRFAEQPYIEVVEGC
jgi:hypothetical protein